jgi:hypothetical protein
VKPSFIVRVFKNRVLMRIAERMAEEIRGARRKLLNVECHNLYSPPNMSIIKRRKIKWQRHVALIENEKSKTGIVGISAGKR